MKNSSSRLTRWALTLQPFVFDIIYRARTLHGNAEGLSRMIIPTAKISKEEEGKNV